MDCICTQYFLHKALVFQGSCLAEAVHKYRQVTKVGQRQKIPGKRGFPQSSGGPDGTATFATTDRDMVKKFSYFTIALFILGINFGGINVGTNAYGVSAAAGVHGAASHIATSFPESGSLAVLGSILITGAMLLRRKWGAHAK